MLQTTAFQARSLRTLIVVAGLTLLCGVANANDHSSYIPANTQYYLGTVKGIPAEHLMAFQPTSFPYSDDMDDDARQMLESFEEVLTNLDEVLPEWGVSENVNFSAYSVGIYPVLRVALDDQQKFAAAIEKLETKHQIKPRLLKIKDYAVRYYGQESVGLTEETDSNSESDTPEIIANAKVMIATSDNDLVVSFVRDSENTELVERMLGITKPEQSMADSGKLKQFRKKWGYGDQYAGFIDMQIIADTVTGAQSQASKDLAYLLSSEDNAIAGLTAMRAEPCRSEINSLAGNMPMIAMGAREFDVSDNQISYVSHAAAEISHSELLSTLKLLRGVMPSSQSPVSPMLSVGLGLTVDRLTQVIGQLSSIVSSISYECPMLAELDALSETDLSAASMGVVMFGGMARGVQGMTLNIFDLEVDPAGAGDPVKAVDTAITLSASDPQALLQTLQMMPQMGILAELPLDGTEISLNSLLPVPMPAGVEFKAAVKDKNIVLFSGENAAEYVGRLGSNNEEGFFRSMIDTRKIIDKVSAVMTMIGQESEQLTDILNYVDSYPKGTIEYTLDFTDNGVELSSNALVAVPE